MLDSLYENIGDKIKSWAKSIFIVETIGAIIAAFAILISWDFDLEDCWWGLLILFLGPIVALVSTWTLYAFGQLVDDVHALRNKEGTAAEVNAKREAEEKAKFETETKARLEVKANAKRMEEELLRREMPKNDSSTTLYMDRPRDFEIVPSWEKGIKKLSSETLHKRILDASAYSDTYRYMCYLELINRNE